jgi:class 3 adenylate cyclase/tetratricopeptide (TPR) repeat protein
VSACPACGTPAVPGARFCFHCGTPLEVSDAERRIVTVLFGDLSDFTSWAEERDPERVGIVVDRVLAACADAVTAVAGHVDKLTGDGIMAVFGAPIAHEDDPERAVRAAAAMQAAVADVLADEGAGRRLGLRVGLNTGEVLAGVQAGVSYTVIGDAVNTAARLSDVAAPGGVLAGRETAVATMPVAAWQALPPLRLKGKREAVMAYELVGLRPAALGEARPGAGEEVPVVGRDAEIGLLAGRLREVVSSGGSAALLVTGDAGLGKTRIVTEIARSAVRQVPGLRVLRGRCVPYGVGRDLAVVSDVVRGACGLGVEVTDPAEATARVRRALERLESPLANDVADRLLRFLGLSEEPSPLAGATGVEAGSRLSQELAAVGELLRALAAEAPLLVVIDDLQWATDITLEALGELGTGLEGPVLVLGAGRPELLQRGSWWRRLPRPEVVPLGPLDPGDATRLVRAHLGALPSPEALRTLLDRAQGNPFFLAELLHLLVDTGTLAPTPAGGWSLVREVPAELLPAGVQSVLTARIDTLDGVARAVLRDAAVLGERVPLGALIELAAVDRDAVLKAVDTLVARGLLRGSPDDPVGSEGRPAVYVPAHALAREAAYASVPKADRAHRHALAAQWAVRSLPEGAMADRAVATHAERALVLAEEMRLPLDDVAWTVRRDAFAAWVRLGEAARSRDDNRSAERLLVRALELGDGVVSEDEMLAARVHLAQTLSSLWRLEEAEEQLAPAVASSADARAHALVVLGDLRRKQGSEDQARAAWVQALAAASDAGQPALASEAIRNLGLQDYFAGRLRAAEERFTEALDLARQVGDARAAGWALQHLAWSATSRGAYDQADAMLADAAGVFASVEDFGGLSWVAGTEAFVRLLAGDLLEARELLAGIEPAAQEAGDVWAVAACLTLDSITAALLGDVARATQRGHESEQAFAALDDAWGRVLALVAQGLAARAAGAHERAVEHLAHAVAGAEASRNQVLGLLALVVTGWVHLDAGEVSRAQTAVERARGKLEGQELEPRATIGLRVLEAQVLRAQGRPAEALALLDGPTAGGMLMSEREVLAARASALVDLGRLAEAQECSTRALTAPGEDAWSQIQALVVRGDVLAAGGDDPCAVWHQALDCVESTGIEALRPAVADRLGPRC